MIRENISDEKGLWGLEVVKREEPKKELRKNTRLEGKIRVQQYVKRKNSVIYTKNKIRE